MPVTITPVPQLSASALQRPAPGERAGMETGAMPLATTLQGLADRAHLGIIASLSRLAWSEQISVDAGGTASTFAVHIGSIQAAVLSRTDGSARVYSAFATTIGAAELVGGGSLASNTWYYIFLWDDAGDVAYEITTTAPSAARVFKTGDTTRRYLGCFRTNSSGAPIPAVTVRGVTTYVQGIVPGYVSLSGPTVGWVALSLAALVPPHARSATADVTLTGDGQWRCIGDAGSTSGVDRFNRPLALNASQEIEWSSASVGSISATVRTYSA